MGNQIADWLQFRDLQRPPAYPFDNDIITTHFYREWREGNEQAPGWRKDALSISSAFLTVADAAKAASTEWGDRDLNASHGWNDEGGFEWGDRFQSRGITLEPWVHIWRHPINEMLQVSLRADFVLYHALVEERPGEFHHPLDGLSVVRLKVDFHDGVESTANVRVHSTYLRDFMAARNLALVIAIIGDRFAYGATREELGIEPKENEVIAPGVVRTMEIGEGHLQGVPFRARSIMWRTIIVKPLDRPRMDATPWHVFGVVANAGNVPDSFLLDSDGQRGPLSRVSTMSYLLFRPSVLSHYMSENGYGARFHMRNWGTAWTPRGARIDVGFNGAGLLNAFAKDLRSLTPSEQAHWAAHSILPTGDICEEMYQTRMLLSPPHSPSVLEMLREARARLADAFRARFHEGLFDDGNLSERKQQEASIGPVNAELRELLDRTKAVYQWLVESMSIDALRRAIGDAATVEREWRQLKLLRVLLEAMGSVDTAESVFSSLRMLNDLRIRAAHDKPSTVGEVATAVGVDAECTSHRVIWLRCMDRVACACNEAADALG